MNDLTGFGCLGAVCLAPVVMFVVGLLIGGNKLPWRVRIEKNAREKYEVDADGTPEWKQ